MTFDGISVLLIWAVADIAIVVTWKLIAWHE